MVCAIFRLVYISSVDLTTNITGTMPTTVFLFILEPNLAILCVSIPMLRPFWSRYKERTRGASKIDDYDLQTIGGSGAKASAGRSGGRSKNRTANDLETQWEDAETGDGNGHYKGGKHDATVTTYPGDESGSEKSLTMQSHQQVPRDTIGVRTEWEVTRH